MLTARRLAPFLAALLMWLAPFTSHAAVLPLPIDESGGQAPQAAGYLGELAYEDPSISVSIEQGREYSTDYWVAHIRLSDPSQLRTTSAGGWESGRTTSGLALYHRVKAVLAINGDYFSYINNGYMIRQGTLYRDLPLGVRDVLLIDRAGDFHLALRADKGSIAPYRDLDIVNSFNFGPALVVGGERVKTYFNNDNAAHTGRQRMGIAQVAAGRLDYVVIATAGPKGDNKGLTLEQFSNLFSALGVQNAYNLDGGNSTMMIFRDSFVNAIHETTMRPISDIIYFASAYLPGGE
ncbi:MAG: phosphodiester glycosidase family protein [Christensenellales bacterium]